MRLKKQLPTSFVNEPLPFDEWIAYQHCAVCAAQLVVLVVDLSRPPYRTCGARCRRALRERAAQGE